MILTPLVSEKAFAGAERGTYTFKIGRQTTKHAVKRAVEAQFKVKVAAVRVAQTPDKTRRRGRQIGRRPGFKKAIVQLQSGQTIEALGAGK